MDTSKWDKRFLKLSEHIATWSKDQSTKVGSVVVTKDRRIVSTGYNGPPRGVDDDPVNHPERHDREASKYLFFEHAERNALYNAANLGVSVRDCTAYITMAPCTDCARGLINSGIRRVVYITEDNASNQRWAANTQIATDMMSEAGVWITPFPRKYLESREPEQMCLPLD